MGGCRHTQLHATANNSELFQLLPSYVLWMCAYFAKKNIRGAERPTSVAVVAVAYKPADRGSGLQILKPSNPRKMDKKHS